MTRFTKLVTEIGLSTFLNCVLVREGARPAMLYQAIDAGEFSTTDPNSKATLAAIAAEFPDLVQTPYGDSSVLFSKTPVSIKDSPSGEELGILLGYPCAPDWPALERMFFVSMPTEPTYSYELLATIRFDPDPAPDTEAPTRTVQILANQALSNKYRDAMETLRAAAEAALRSNPLTAPHVERVELKETVNVPIPSVLETLKAGRELTNDEWAAVREALFNMDFGLELRFYPFDLVNPFQRGVLATLLTYYLHEPLAPFFPLQDYPDQHKEVSRRTRDLEATILSLLPPPPL